LLKHLRTAAMRLRTARLPDDDRRQLGHLFLAAVNRKEKELREGFRPIVVAVLNESGLVPTNLPERVARDTGVEELLDHVVENGFTTLGDLRDIVARSQLKLPDLAASAESASRPTLLGRFGAWLHRVFVAAPRELVKGDQLLKADKLLGFALDGVHRRG